MVTILILQIIAVIIDIYIAFSNDKKKILILAFLYNAFVFILYLLTKDFSTMFSYIIIVARSTIYIYQKQLKKYKYSYFIPIAFMVCHIISGIKTAESLWHILTIAAPIIVCYLLWFEKSRQKMRLEQAASDLLWLVYNIHAGLYILCISYIITITSGIIAFVTNINNKAEMAV